MFTHRETIFTDREASRDGIEPPLSGPEPGVIPLDHPETEDQPIRAEAPAVADAKSYILPMPSDPLATLTDQPSSYFHKDSNLAPQIKSLVHHTSMLWKLVSSFVPHTGRSAKGPPQHLTGWMVDTQDQPVRLEGIEPSQPGLKGRFPDHSVVKRITCQRRLPRA